MQQHPTVHDAIARDHVAALRRDARLAAKVRRSRIRSIRRSR
jgi:hypothetical protein